MASIDSSKTFVIGEVPRISIFDTIRGVAEEFSIAPSSLHLENVPAPLPNEPGYSAHIMKKIKFDHISDMYCVKCRERKLNVEVETVEMKNGKPALKARCPACGTGMYKIGSK